MIRIPFLIFALIATVGQVAGCGSDYPGVSGKVTINGKPAEGVSVLFVPVSTKEVPFPGPFAEGKTDKDGKYSLVTRDGDAGGTVGPNVVEFYVGGSIEVEFMKSSAAMLLGEAGKDKSHPSYKKGKDMMAEIKTLEAMSTGDKLTPGATAQFDVPPKGTQAADFELSELTGS